VQPIIRAENLSKIYRAGKLDVSALKNVSFSIEPGEFVSIVGPSGSGKSTLFYLLGGLTGASSGKVIIDGVDFATLNDGERTRMRKSKIAFIFQKFNLLPTLSARANIEIAYDISGSKQPLDSGYLNQLQQRVAIARALVTRPAIVLADEPTGNLDTKNSDAVLEMLSRSNREFKQTVLMITHNPEAATIADRILHMRDGEITGIEAGKRTIAEHTW